MTLSSSCLINAPWIHEANATLRFRTGRRTKWPMSCLCHSRLRGLGGACHFPRLNLNLLISELRGLDYKGAFSLNRGTLWTKVILQWSLMYKADKSKLFPAKGRETRSPSFSAYLPPSTVPRSTPTIIPSPGILPNLRRPPPPTLDFLEQHLKSTGLEGIIFKVLSAPSLDSVISNWSQTTWGQFLINVITSWKSLLSATQHWTVWLWLCFLSIF